MLIWRPLVEAALPNDFSSTKRERCFDQRMPDEQDVLRQVFRFRNKSFFYTGTLGVPAARNSNDL